MDTKFYLKVDNLRPDYRTIISLLWSDFEDVDVEEDEMNPAVRDWKRVTISRRADDQQRVEVSTANVNPLIMEITSPNAAIASVVAYFLASETKSPWATAIRGPYNSNLENLGIMAGKKFNLKTALERAKSSIWRFSSIENPYPNQRILKT